METPTWKSNLGMLIPDRLNRALLLLLIAGTTACMPEVSAESPQDAPLLSETAGSEVQVPPDTHPDQTPPGAHRDYDAAEAADGLPKEAHGGPDVPVCAHPRNSWAPQVADDNLWYTTQYVNVVLQARDEAGQELRLAAGRHGKHFPYFSKQQPWDNVLLSLNDLALSAAGQNLDGLDVVIDEKAETVRLFFCGAMDEAEGDFRTAGVPHAVSIDITASADFQPPKFLGVPLEPTGDCPPIGLTYRPIFLALGSEGVVRVDGEGLAVVSLLGEAEMSTLTFFKEKSLSFRYDYLALASVDLGVAYVVFQGHALYSDEPGGAFYDSILADSMAWGFTLAADGLTEMSKEEIDGWLQVSSDATWVTHVEDVGLGSMSRSLVEVEQPPAIGLREAVQ